MVFPVADTTVDVTPYIGAACLRGWSFQETTGGAGASLVIFDGPAAAGQIVAPITLLAGESTRDYPSGDGILLRTGATVVVVAGEIAGALWLTPLLFAEDVAFAFGQSAPFYVHGGV